jgi:hypothetical protein
MWRDPGTVNDPAHAVNLVVTNFSGGKRHTGRGAIDRGALRDMARLASDMRTSDGFIMAVQEMTSSDPGLPTRAVAFEEALDSKALSSFIPRVSTAWYPLEEKWGEKIQADGAYNEGLCVVTGDAGMVLMSWSLAPRQSAGPANVGSSTRVIDLPNFIFPGLEKDGSQGPWLESSIVINGTPETVHFRPAYYHGNRNSDPRVAQACLLGWRDGPVNGAFNPVCVLVNVHLSTLTSELREGGRGRMPNSDATFLRSMQLDLIARYVKEVQAETDGLPVIIAGDFNAEPDWPEMVSFADQVASTGLLSSAVCWKCGTLQRERPLVEFYSRSGVGWDLTTESPAHPTAPRLSTRAVCSNEECLEPRFTHKGHGQLLDNVFIVPGRNDSPWGVEIGVPHVDVRWGYSDHAAIVVPVRFYRPVDKSTEVDVGNADIRN